MSHVFTSTASNNSPTSSAVRGRWVRNTLLQSKLSNNNINRIFDDFSESVQYPKIDLDQITWAARKAQFPWRQSFRPPLDESQVGGKCCLTELPTEILVQIFEYVLPCDETFHVFEFENDYRRKSTMIHRFLLPSLPPANRTGPDGQTILDSVAGNIQPYITALATVNHSLSHVFHDILYGSNRFIFELGSCSVWPRPVAHSHSNLQSVESWSRIYESSHTQNQAHKPACCWPLTPRTAAHLRDITLLITKSYQELHKAERILLTTQLNYATSLLTQARNLTSLTVDMSTPSGPHEALSQRLGWKTKGDRPHVLRLREPILCSAACEDCGGFAGLWGLLAGVSVGRAAILSGHICSEMARGLREGMLCGGGVG